MAARSERSRASVVSAQADPLNVWVPAENVVATWESVTLMSKLYNPAAEQGAASKRSWSLAARVDIVDVNGLIGFDSTARGTLVLDEKPGVVYSEAVPSRYCHFYWPLRYIKKMPTPGQWVSELQPYKFTVDMPIDPNRPYPLVLSRVEWSMYVLVYTETKTVDVPFSPAADWVTLTPGLEIVEQATAEAGKYQYRLAARYPQQGPQRGRRYRQTGPTADPEVISRGWTSSCPRKSVQGLAAAVLSGGSSSGGARRPGDRHYQRYGVSPARRRHSASTPPEAPAAQLRFILENVPVRDAAGGSPERYAPGAE
jgi:hypothetical protein